jgi:hypothetical protein
MDLTNDTMVRNTKMSVTFLLGLILVLVRSMSVPSIIINALIPFSLIVCILLLFQLEQWWIAIFSLLGGIILVKMGRRE